MFVSRLPSRPALIALGSAVCVALVVTSAASSASAAPGDAGFLGAADTFSVLAHTTVTNSGLATMLDRDLGVDAGLLTPGLTPLMVSGTTHLSDALSISAQTDATTAANDLMAVPSYVYGAPDLTGHTFLAGSYSSATDINYTGNIVLQGDADDVFIFTAVAAIIVGGSTSMTFIGGAQACNVFWRSGAETTIGTNSAFVGTVIAGTSVSVNTDATIDGRLIAQTGQVSLLNNKFTTTACGAGGDGNRGLSVAPSAPTVTPAPGGGGGGGGAGGGGNSTLPSTGGTLAATGVDATRPALVAAFLALLGLVLISGSRLRRARSQSR